MYLGAFACVGFKKDKNLSASVTFPVLQYVFKSHPASITWLLFLSYAKGAGPLKRKEIYSISQVIQKIYE